jgi:threonine synthase
MSCKCANCQRGEDEVELNHLCDDCRAALLPQRVSKEIPSHVSKIWDLLIEAQAEPSHVVHILTMHPKELDKYLMHAMATIQLACEVLDKEYPYTGPV